jgi:hypothetical protein
LTAGPVALPLQALPHRPGGFVYLPDERSGVRALFLPRDPNRGTGRLDDHDAYETQLGSMCPRRCSPTSITLTGSSNARAGRASTPSTRRRSRRFAPDPPASRGDHISRQYPASSERSSQFPRGTLQRMFKHTAHDQIAGVVATHPHPYTGAGLGAVNAPPRHLMRVAMVCASKRQTGPTITAVLQLGPLADRRIDVDVVEGRPPKTIDVPADDGSRCRYCLADWAQTGPSAIYTFLYLV